MIEIHREALPITRPFTQTDQDDKIEQMVRKRKESESFDVKIHGFVLIDLFPYERKQEMISAFENIFSLPRTGTRRDSIRDRIRDMSEGGLAGFRGPLGNIHNINKLNPDRNQAIPTNERFIWDDRGVMTELPEEIDRIEVWIAQDVDFCYYVYYFCYVNKDHSKIDRDMYIHSGDFVPFSDRVGFGERARGPEFDPYIA